MINKDMINLILNISTSFFPYNFLVIKGFSQNSIKLSYLLILLDPEPLTHLPGLPGCNTSLKESAGNFSSLDPGNGLL